MLVSAIEKTPEISSRMPSAVNWADNGMSSIFLIQIRELGLDCSGSCDRCTRSESGILRREFRSSCSAEHDFEHELAADVGEQQHQESGEGPAHRDASPPPVKPASAEQRGEYQPRENAEHGLVIKAHRLAEKLFGKHDAGNECQREQHETR